MDERFNVGVLSRDLRGLLPARDHGHLPIQLVKKVDALPLTRDYIGETEKNLQESEKNPVWS